MPQRRLDYDYTTVEHHTGPTYAVNGAGSCVCALTSGTCTTGGELPYERTDGAYTGGYTYVSAGTTSYTYTDTMTSDYIVTQVSEGFCGWSML